jgi:hypothetical protein
MSSEDYRYSGRVLKNLGYCMDFKLTRLFRITAHTLLTLVRSA